ncbi:glycosyltransferase family 2 protein [Flavobacterium sp. RSB2_4_14]|uniref:glycosyltransferase family 2 protein n=1 Tax=Flavobacterium sp. RSB2_4_14 TaxID=3447665 RepID=UPI003F31450B
MISILIRNKNEEVALERALLSIKKQNFNVPYEIVIVDDNSSDNSVAIAQKHGCKVVQLDKQFTYGYAINFGVKHCQYEIIVLLSSHNILLSNDFPEKLVSYFSDKNVAAVRCTPITNTKQIEQSLKSNLLITKENYNHKKDWQNLIIANCSAIRKSVASAILFNETIRSNEEKLWSLDVIEKGFVIISNVPCYFFYNKKKSYNAEVCDIIGKYQIDGIKPISVSYYFLNIIKSFPWSIKIAFSNWYTNLKMKTQILIATFKYNKGQYK